MLSYTIRLTVQTMYEVAHMKFIETSGAAPMLPLYGIIERLR